MHLLSIFHWSICFLVTIHIVKPLNEDLDCRSKITCGECIQTGLECVWCSSEEYTFERCDSKENLSRKNCKLIVDEPNQFTVIRNQSLNEEFSDSESNQMQPQEIKLKLRKGKSERFKIKYRQSIDYPVDLYYLMDLSYTMRDDKETLANIGNTLANQMKEITKDFRLGFGSFVDKTVMPYVDTLPLKLQSPCPNCHPPYSFRNHMSLSDNTELFAKKVNNSHISGNLDGPEGTLDAIVQAIVCEEEIGWRPKSRKLLVITTDATFHQAGDGRLAGIYLPNDLKCHLDDRGYYNKSSYQDYPSINQISQIVKKHKVNLIFAVIANKIAVYKELSKLIEGSSTAQLKKDSSNIVDLVKEEYKKITSSILFKDDSTNNFKLTYRSTCLEGKLIETQTCKGLRVGAEVEFEIEIELINCPLMIEKESRQEIIKISPVGLNLHDSLRVEVELACKCECEKEVNYIHSDQVCTKGNGYLKCGLCECLPEYYGKLCECKFDEKFDLTSLNSNRLNQGCFSTMNDTKICSGNGQCSCNTCFCDEPYTGKHCECDPYSCERFNNLLCNGHGFCECGRCECESKWTGNACQCLKSNETCLDPFNNKLCNNQGECVCGRCQCNQNDEDDRLFSGKYCQKCSNCIDHFCQAFNQIIYQQVVDQIDEIQSKNYSSYLIDEFKQLENMTHSNEELESCEFLGNNSCAYTYRYRSDKDGLLILYALRQGKCQAKVDIKATAISIVVSTLIIGVIGLIIWKLLTSWYDKREFERFESQIKNLNWESKDLNPLYRPSNSQFRNPAFRNQARKSRLKSLFLNY